MELDGLVEVLTEAKNNSDLLRELAILFVTGKLAITDSDGHAKRALKDWCRKNRIKERFVLNPFGRD